MKSIEIIKIQNWHEPISSEVQDQAVQALEYGKVLFLPLLAFPLNSRESVFLSPEKVDPSSKNISFNVATGRLNGTLYSQQEALPLKQLIARYAAWSRSFLERLIPHYASSLIQAKTSFRPIEIAGRKSSYRKDDTLLHVDSFPSNPTKGQRILRMFTNINPDGKSRVWKVGEPFQRVVETMMPRASAPIRGSAHVLKWLGITKNFRTPYDHYMLQMHDLMKGDKSYQQHVDQEEVHFPPHSSWIVYTDQVSHAALSGQYVLEQTFHLPVPGMKNENTSPLRVLEKYLNRRLVVE